MKTELLYLTANAKTVPEIPMRTLVVDPCADGRGSLSSVQQAHYALRSASDRAFVIADGWTGLFALALAAQLMVDRVVLLGDPFEAVPDGLKGFRAYARRNLSLIAAECVLIGAPAPRADRLAREMGRRAAPINVTEILSFGELSADWLYTPKITCRNAENVYNILSDAFWKGRNQ